MEHGSFISLTTTPITVESPTKILLINHLALLTAEYVTFQINAKNSETQIYDNKIFNST